jgi:nucleolar MIF4G domain-containing protein 1
VSTGTVASAWLTSVVLAHEPIRVTLNDLLNAETKGKWWLVGAAWAGNPLVDRQKEIEAAKTAETTQPKKKAKQVVDDDEELDLLGTDNHEELIKLAKKQGMNTDIRRSIFIIMMTSDVSLVWSRCIVVRPFVGLRTCL